MRLAGNGGQQHPRPAGTRAGQLVQGIAQHHLHRLGVEVLLEDFEPALHPGLADLHVQRRHHVEHEAAQADARQRARHQVTQGLGIVLPDRGHENHPIEHGGRVQLARWRYGARPGGVGQALEVGRRHGHDAPGPVTGIEQALDRAQALDLVEGVAALTRHVADWHRKTVAALPDAQGVLAQPGISLDRANRHRDRSG